MSIGFGSDIATLGAEALQEQFFEEVPCGTCDRPAQLFSPGHGCAPSPASAYKCIECWQKWYRGLMTRFLRDRRVKCRRCKQHFGSVEAFSDFRPF